MTQTRDTLTEERWAIKIDEINNDSAEIDE